MFARFADLLREPDEAAKREFHNLMIKFGKLGERRNEIVHSKYAQWINVEGACVCGLLRQNSRLRAAKGMRDELEK